MAPLTFGAALTLAVAVMAGLHVPLLAALAIAGLLGGFLFQALLIPGGTPAAAFWGMAEMAQGVIATLGHQPALLAIPVFVTLGNLALVGGLATRLYDAAAFGLRGVPGGLAIAALLGSGGFAAISGSSVACATTMGRICVPEMLARGYDPRLAGASVAAGGTLGALIPPSILLILIAVLSDTPVPALFLAGLVPGLLSLLVMVIVVVAWLKHDAKAAPAASPAPPDGPTGAARDALGAVKAVWPLALIFAALMAAAAVGMVALLAVGIAAAGLTAVLGRAQGRLSAEVLGRALAEAAVQTAALLGLAVAALLFHRVLALTALPVQLALWLQLWDWSGAAVLGALVILCLGLGMLLDPAAILVVVLPFAMPLIAGYGLDPLWFAVLLVKLLEIALITPPIGLNVFIIASLSRDLGILTVFQGVTRFLAADMVVIAALILFPRLATLLPGLFWH